MPLVNANTYVAKFSAIPDDKTILASSWVAAKCEHIALAVLPMLRQDRSWYIQLSASTVAPTLPYAYVIVPDMMSGNVTFHSRLPSGQWERTWRGGRVSLPLPTHTRTDTDTHTPPAGACLRRALFSCILTQHGKRLCSTWVWFSFTTRQRCVYEWGRAVR